MRWGTVVTDRGHGTRSRDQLREVRRVHSVSRQGEHCRTTAINIGSGGRSSFGSDMESARASTAASFRSRASNRGSETLSPHRSVGLDLTGAKLGSPLAADVKYSSRPGTRVESRPVTALISPEMSLASTSRRHRIREMLRKRGKGEPDHELVGLVQAEIDAVRRTQMHLGELEHKLMTSMVTLAASSRHRSKPVCAAASFNRFSMQFPTKKTALKYVHDQPKIAPELSMSKVKTMH